MKLTLTLPVLSLLLWTTAAAQTSVAGTSASYETRDSITRGPYTLIVINKQEGFDTAVINRMVETYFTVYPKLAETFNREAAKKVTFLIDPSYEGVAATARDVIMYNPEWFVKHPGDIDVVTHEAMHVVQAYKRHVPGWVTEGIADYVRYKFGVDNEGAGWKLPAFSPEHSYRDSYRITARFFNWIEENIKKGFVVALDSRARAGQYNAAVWKEITGKTLDELWQEYAASHQQ
jgi:hypothetical protein